MAVQPNIENFQLSITNELRAAQNRIRDLIGDKHWLSDGEHKETILRNVLRSHLPESLHVGKGFVCGKDGSSTQIDILITDNNNPVLYKQGELRIVTPEAVRAIVEVKTSISTEKLLLESLEKMANNAELIRNASTTSNCWAGLFIFDHKKAMTQPKILDGLANTAEGNDERVINCVVEGPKSLFRFWHRGRDTNSPISGSAWHSYFLDDLAPAYFLGDLIFAICWEKEHSSEDLWLPRSSEDLRQYYVGSQERVVMKFERSSTKGS